MGSSSREHDRGGARDECCSEVPGHLVESHVRVLPRRLDRYIRVRMRVTSMRLWSYKTCPIALFGVQAFDRAPSRAVFGVFVKIEGMKRLVRHRRW